jgi:cytochrome b subunit of formate dehydrogenase
MSEEKKAMQADLQIPRRFTVPQRIEHFVLLVSFTLLGLTGLVQKYALNSLSEWLIDLLGGIQTTRVIHRAAAIVFALLTVYHAIVLAYKFFVRRVQMTMMPVPKDAVDALHSILHGLCMRKDPPQMPRYNFAEKMEYWALIWGGLIMLLTGFMLWNPLITALFLPGQFIPAAKAAHGGEAVLAVLAIIVWHFYNVHIRMFNKSMFTGKLTRHQMEEEHSLEWNDLAAGKVNPATSSQTVRRRRFIFMPIAIIFAALGIGFIYWAATAETTAISTLPTPISRSVSYSPRAPESTIPAKFVTVSAPHIPHTTLRLEQCYQCHAKSGMKPVPSNHEGRPIESCRICHKPGAPTKSKRSATDKEEGTANGPWATPHPTDAVPFKDCINCHGKSGMKPAPSNHTGWPMESCLICHKPDAPMKPKRPATDKEDEKAGSPKTISHPTAVAPYKNCSTCHAKAKIKPAPSNHEGWPMESCLVCHKPGAPKKPKQSTAE